MTCPSCGGRTSVRDVGEFDGVVVRVRVCPRCGPRRSSERDEGETRRRTVRDGKRAKGKTGA